MGNNGDDLEVPQFSEPPMFQPGEAVAAVATDHHRFAGYGA